jgi:L-fuconolactonase
MAAAGVDGGVLTPQMVYGLDCSLELQAAADFPRKFVVIGVIDHLAEDVEEQVRAYAERGMVGFRILRISEAALARNDYTRLLDSVQAQGLAIAVFLTFPLKPQLRSLFTRYEGIRFLIDHLGVGHAPPAFGLPPVDPWEHLPATLALAQHPNVHVKLTGASALSSEPYPFADIWDGVKRIVDAYGAERVMWGSDITRTGSLHTYAQATHFLREIGGFGPNELELIYGKTLRNVLRWDPDAYLAKIGL